MANLKLLQMASCELKLDSAIDFCLNSHDNRMTLIGSSNDICVMDLMYSCETLILLPYTIKYVPIPQHKPFLNIVKNVNLVKLYDAGSVQESQELSLDPIYTAECSVEPPKPRVLHAEILPIENTDLCCILNTYGACEIFQKSVITQEWELLRTNLSNIIITDILPSRTSPENIRSYQELKMYVNQYLITSFTWSRISSSAELIIYLGTAAGYVVALKYMETDQEFKEYCHLKTSLTRISYITVNNNIILVGCDRGQVSLITINHNTSSLKELECLWSKQDRMACRKAIISYSEILNSYLVVFCKAAHILVYRLDVDGSILSSLTLYVGGIKITGIESLTENEFFITTIMGTIKHLTISSPNKDELKIDEQIIEHEFDSANYQILGIGTTKSRNLWTFLLYRNKDYTHQSKNHQFSAFLSVAKLNNKISLIQLINMNTKSMDVAKDIVMAMNLDIFSNMDMQQYNDFMPLEKLHFPTNLNDAFLQKLQIKFMIISKMAVYQKKKYKKQKPLNLIDLEFLELSIQSIYILHRLQYLQKLYSSDIKLSSFQQLSVVCMIIKFSKLLIDLGKISNDEDNYLHTTAEHLAILISADFEKNKFPIENFTVKAEHCFICNDEINAITFDKCQQEHDIKRCSISYTQLSPFQTQYCPYCFAKARIDDDDGSLQELFPNDEFVKCKFCRFLFKHEII